MSKEFNDKVVSDVSSTLTIALCSLGDRLGLFKDLTKHGACTSKEFSQRNGLNERYAREWLFGLTAAKYLEYNLLDQTFMLPKEHIPVLAEESGPLFFGGGIQQMAPLWKVIDQVEEAFKNGGGVPLDSYHPSWFEGIERKTAVWFENFLIQKWLPLIPAIVQKLESGIKVADVGCGNGRAIIKMATTYPNSSYIGLDIYEPSVELANKKAKEAGLEDIVSFKVTDISKDLGGKYDLITAFDVIHDLGNPRGALRVIRESLNPDGAFLLLEYKSSDNLEENFNPGGVMRYGFSVLFCLTTSLHTRGEGLGTMGMSPAKVTELCEEAGFSTVEKIPMEDPSNTLFLIKP